MTIDDLKHTVSSWIDAHKDEFIASGEALLRMPELAYRETRTAEYVRQTFRKWNLPLHDQTGLSGGDGPLFL